MWCVWYNENRKKTEKRLSIYNITLLSTNDYTNDIRYNAKISIKTKMKCRFEFKKIKKKHGCALGRDNQ